MNKVKTYQILKQIKLERKMKQDFLFLNIRPTIFILVQIIQIVQMRMNHFNLPLVLFVLCMSVTQCEFTLIGSLVNSNGAMAISPSTRSGSRLIYYRSEGSLYVVNTETLEYMRTVQHQMLNPIRKIQWSKSGVIFLASDYEVELIDDIFYSKSFYYQFAERQDPYIICFISRNSDWLIAAVTQDNEISVISRNSTFFITTDSPVTSLTFDNTGRYLYYIQNYTLNVAYSISSRSIFNIIESSDKQQLYVSSPDPSNSDITVTTTNNYKLNIYDDYRLLGSRQIFLTYVDMCFSQDGTELFGVTRNLVETWQVSYSGFTWPSYRPILLGTGNIQSISANNYYLAVGTTDGQIYLYQEKFWTIPIMIIIGAVCICLFIVVVVSAILFHKRKAKLREKLVAERGDYSAWNNPSKTQDAFPNNNNSPYTNSNNSPYTNNNNNPYTTNNKNPSINNNNNQNNFVDPNQNSNPYGYESQSDRYSKNQPGKYQPPAKW